MKKIIVVLGLLSSSAAAEDCIENLDGQVVCGREADAVRERIRAEIVAKEKAKSEYQSSGAGFSSGSVYSGFRNTAFVRGGYIFASRGGGFASGESAPSVAVGVRFQTYRSGRSTIGWETELLYARDSDEGFLLGVPVDATLTGFAGLTGFRWDYDSSIGVNPFVSVGAGPGYLRLKVDDGFVSITDDDWTFAYSGRAGVSFDIAKSLSLETGYRYLGTTNSGTPGFHSGEVGLNFRF